jgi:hypothetical protein
VDQAPVPSQTPAPPPSNPPAVEAAPAAQQFDADAKVEELRQLRASDRQGFIGMVLDLNTDQLEAVSRKESSLLTWLTTDEICQIIKAKKDQDLNFCKIILDRTYAAHLPQSLPTLNADQLAEILEKDSNLLTWLTTDQICQLLPALNVEQLAVVLEKDSNLLNRLNSNQICQLLPALNVEQLEVILGNSPLLLNRLNSNQILWIFQDKDKDPDFRAAVLWATTVGMIQSVLERDSYAHVVDILGIWNGITWPKY